MKPSAFRNLIAKSDIHFTHSAFLGSESLLRCFLHRYSS